MGAKVAQRAQEYNQSLVYAQSDSEFECTDSESQCLSAAKGLSVFAVDTASVCVDTVKMAQDGSGDVVLRVYEAFGGRTRVTLSVALCVARANVCNLLEQMAEEVTVKRVGTERSEIELFMQPFELRTLRLQM